MREDGASDLATRVDLLVLAASVNGRIHELELRIARKKNEVFRWIVGVAMVFQTVVIVGMVVTLFRFSGKI